MSSGKNTVTTNPITNNSKNDTKLAIHIKNNKYKSFLVTQYKVITNISNIKKS